VTLPGSTPDDNNPLCFLFYHELNSVKLEIMTEFAPFGFDFHEWKHHVKTPD